MSTVHARTGSTTEKNGNGTLKKTSRRRASPLAKSRARETFLAPNGASAAPATELNKQQVLEALVALKRGDFTVRLPIEWTGIDGKIADAFNEVVELNSKVANELERLSVAVGKEGR